METIADVISVSCGDTFTVAVTKGMTIICITKIRSFLQRFTWYCKVIFRYQHFLLINASLLKTFRSCFLIYFAALIFSKF